jgi:hypothetical protein
VFRHEDMASRHTLAVGVAAILTVCSQRGVGKGGKREGGGSELKLRRRVFGQRSLVPRACAKVLSSYETIAD